MNSVNFSSLVFSKVVIPVLPTAKKQEFNFKLAQLIDNVKRPVKLLISLKQDDYNYLYALQDINPKNKDKAINNIKDCSIAPTTKQAQTKTVCEEDNSLSKFLQVNKKSISKIRYVEKSKTLLCSVEVVKQILTLPVGLNLQWLVHWEADKHLQVEDKEDYQALLLKV